MRRAVILLPFAGGCATVPALPPAPPHAAATADYALGCPDVLSVRFADRPGWDAVVSVDVDGTLPLGDAGRPRVQGLTAAKAAAAIAESANANTSAVTVTVLDPRSATVTVAGPEDGRVKTVPYRGPEPVADLLRRAGAVQPGGTDWHDVTVVRPNVAAGGKAEFTAVDLEAALLDGDNRTNVPVRAGDHVYVGATRRASFARLLPAWLRPAYRQLVGLLPE